MTKDVTAPEFLYHYTSINTLAQILDTNKIRFNRLDKVDDVTESLSTDLGNFGRFFFVSCWTDSPEENIPLWSMYTPGMTGVRIKLPVKMFKTYKVESRPDLGVTVTDVDESVLPFESIFNDHYWAVPSFLKYDSFLQKIRYTSDEELYKKVKTVQDGNRASFNWGEFCTYKKDVWGFQSEWRFLLNFIPVIGKNQKNNQAWLEVFIKFLLHSVRHGDLPFDQFFLELKKEAIDQIEVVMGPKCNHGHRKIVEALLEKYCNGPTILDSHLAGTIR